LCGLYLPIALIGALVTPPMVMLTVAPTVSLVATGVLAGLVRACQPHLPDRRTLTITATAAAGAVVDETVDADAADRVVALSAVPARERSDDAGVRAGARPIVSPRRRSS
jgi:hypothetical protein